MQLGGHAGQALRQFGERMALGRHPVGVIVTLRPIITWGMAVLPVAVAVADVAGGIGLALLNALVCAAQVELANETAVIAQIGQPFGHQRRMGRKRF